MPFFVSGAFGSSRMSHLSNEEVTCSHPRTPTSSPCPEPEESAAEMKETLVNIQVYLVDGKSDAYCKVYNRVNRRITVNFNSLDCKV